jgi:hypothetical protein
MKADGVLRVGEDESFRVIVDILNNVFGKTNSEGEPLKLAKRSVWNISPGKRAWFPYIAVEKEKGLWQPSVDRGWLNIPAQNDSVITQVELRNSVIESDEDFIPDGLYAVFMAEKASDPEKFRFYGVFECAGKPTGHINHWKKTSDELVCKEWQAQQK